MPQAPQHREELRGLAHLLAQLPRPGIGVCHFRGRIALGGDQRRAQGGLQVQLLLGTLGGVWQGREQLQPLGEVRDRFHIGRALDGPLARPLPVGNSLLAEARLGVVMRQQFGLGLDGLGKLGLQAPAQSADGTAAGCSCSND